MEYFLTCMICGHQEIVDKEEVFLEKGKKWLFLEAGMVCPRCCVFPEAIECMMEYRKKKAQIKKSCDGR